MKLATPLLVFAAFSLSACHTTTLTNRRDLYMPSRASGPYTEALDEGTWKDGVKPKKATAKEAKPDAATPPPPPAAI